MSVVFLLLSPFFASLSSFLVLVLNKYTEILKTVLNASLINEIVILGQSFDL